MNSYKNVKIRSVSEFKSKLANDIGIKETAFSPEDEQAIRNFCKRGGNLTVEITGRKTDSSPYSPDLSTITTEPTKTSGTPSLPTYPTPPVDLNSINPMLLNEPPTFLINQLLLLTSPSSLNEPNQTIPKPNMTMRPNVYLRPGEIIKASVSVDVSYLNKYRYVTGTEPTMTWSISDTSRLIFRDSVFQEVGRKSYYMYVIAKEAGGSAVVKVVSYDGTYAESTFHIKDSFTEDEQKIRNTYINELYNTPKEISDPFAYSQNDYVTYGNYSPPGTTIETLYKNLHPDNKPTNPIYVEVKGNDVTITAHIRFTGDANLEFPGTKKTYAEIAVEGIESKWKKDKYDKMNGSTYDFVERIQGINLKTKVFYQVPGVSYIADPNQKYLTIEIDNSDPTWFDRNTDNILIKKTGLGQKHRSHQKGEFGRDNWSMTNSGKIVLYPIQQGKNKADDYRYLENMYAAVAAHEFGHALGLGDAYLKNDDGEILKDNEEISDGVFGISGSMMFRNGKVYANDIEMVLEAFRTNKWQYAFDNGNNKKSIVIRKPQEFEKKDDEN